VYAIAESRPCVTVCCSPGYMDSWDNVDQAVLNFYVSMYDDDVCSV